MTVVDAGFEEIGGVESVDLKGADGVTHRITIDEFGQINVDGYPAGIVGDTDIGFSTVRKFPFEFDTAGLLTGVAIFTPTIGDVLLDSWIEVTHAWDGTTPTVDVGTSFPGWYGSAIATGKATIPVPKRFTTNNPVKLVVSQDGTPTGADPASTQGMAILYLVTVTPV